MILTIDFGTTNLKAALIDKEGNFYNYFTKEVATKIDKDIFEVNPDDYIQFLVDYLKLINTKEIEAIAISSNGPSFLSLYSDIKFEDGNFIYKSSPTRLWMDKRGANYSKQVSNYYDTYIDGSFFLPAILSIKDNNIDQYNLTSHFLTIDGFINYALTDKIFTVSNADQLLKYYWNEDSLEYFDLNKSKFPPFIKSGKIIGKIKKEIANYYNLDENIKVIAGGLDFYFSIIGSKVDNVNIMADIMGTSEGLNLCISKPIKDDRFLCYEHPLTNLYNLSGVLSNTGIALSWLRKMLNIEDLEFNEIYKLSEKAKPNNLIFLPYLTGERAPIWNTEATSTLFNLTINTGKEEIANAVLEGTIFAFKSTLLELEKIGYSTDEIHISSSKTNLDYYYQLKSDITNKKFVVYTTLSAELLGLSMLGYTSLKNYNSLKDAIKNMNQKSKEFTPNIDNQTYYERKFNLFNSLYKATSKLMLK